MIVSNRLPLATVLNDANGRFEFVGTADRAQNQGCLLRNDQQRAGQRPGRPTDDAKGWVYELSPGEGEKLTTKIEGVLEKPEES